MAGTETTTSTLRWGILCLLHYPDTQKKLYNEISAVVGETNDMNTIEGLVVLKCSGVPLMQCLFHFSFSCGNSLRIKCVTFTKNFDF